MKRLAWSTAVILVTFTVLLLVWELRATAVLFMTSLIIAAHRLVPWWIGFLPGECLAAWHYYSLMWSLSALPLRSVIILTGTLFAELQQVVTDVTSGYEQLRSQWPHGTPVQQSVARYLPVASDLYAAITGPQGGMLLQTSLGLTMGSFDLLGQLLIVLILSVYWSTDQEHFKRLWVSLLPLRDACSCS